MIKKFIIAVFATVFIAGCSHFSDASWPQRVTAVEAGYASVVDTLSGLREPCVKPVRNNDCVITDDIYKKLNVYVQKANEALTKAKTYADAGQIEQAEEWLKTAKFNLDTLKELINGIKKLKEDLN